MTTLDRLDASDLRHVIIGFRDAGVETALNFRVPATVVDEAFASLPVK